MSDRKPPGEVLAIVSWIVQALGWRLEAHDLPRYTETVDPNLPNHHFLALRLTDLNVTPLPASLRKQVKDGLLDVHKDAVRIALARIVTPERIRTWRAYNGLSERDAARRIGVAPKTLARYEAGSRPNGDRLLWVYNALVGNSTKDAPVNWAQLAQFIASQDS